ncbi:hypothetical protein DWZ16_10300 [Clostridium sp. AF29-8BH]|uniref:hypothetical protein n=1 Tax=Clostridium sp. AF29-8BH TaxID=2293009 RepID=UPI000E4C94BA|nr:hypothetical protein DWZ16_10300 [Clostridium sp. AF29-8BH]
MKVKVIAIMLMLCSMLLCACSTNNTTANEKKEVVESAQESTIASERETQSIETGSEELETVKVTEATEESLPFKVQIDKPALQNGREKETTVVITTEIEDWEYTASVVNGKISNYSSTSFTYTVPKDEEIREDTLTIYYPIMKMVNNTNTVFPLSFQKLLNK